MSDRYRIVEHKDGNGVTFYTIQIECSWFFGLKYFRTLKVYSSSGEHSTFKMFDTLEDARKFLRGREWTQTIVEEGVL